MREHAASGPTGPLGVHVRRFRARSGCTGGVSSPAAASRPVTGEPPTGGSLDDAVAAVRSARSGHPASEVARDEILAFVAERPDALFRTCLDGHITGSALVVHDDRERILVMLHAKLGRWLQPGGHADGEGHLAAVALREATEETGIAGLQVVVPAVDCDVHVIPARPGEPEHRHLDLRFVVLAPPDAVAVGNDESHQLRWVDLATLDGLAGDDSLRRLARAGLAVARDL